MVILLLRAPGHQNVLQGLGVGNKILEDLVYKNVKTTLVSLLKYINYQSLHRTSHAVEITLKLFTRPRQVLNHEALRIKQN